MKKTEVIEILDYMFEFLFASSKENGETEINDIEIKQYLVEAGFDDLNIENALNYLKSMAEEVQVKNISDFESSVRIYSDNEKQQLGTLGLGLLAHLENTKAISPAVRELAIEQIVDLPYKCSSEELLWTLEYIALNANNPELPELLSNISYENDTNGTRH